MWLSVIHHLPASKPTQVRIRIRTEATVGWGGLPQQLAHLAQLQAAVAVAAGTLEHLRFAAPKKSQN